MTHEIQLAHAAGLPTPGVYDPAAVMAASPGAPGGRAQPTGLKKIHRLLRGRYPLAIGLGALCAVAGGLAGFMSAKPTYESKGLISIKTTLPSKDMISPDVPAQLGSFLKEQMSLLGSRDLAMNAFDQPEWRSLGRGNSEEVLTKFLNNLDIDTIVGSTIIKVSYQDPDPKAAVAGTTALCNAYKDYYDKEDPFGIDIKLRALESQKGELGAQLSNLQDQINRFSMKYHTDDVKMLLGLNLQTEQRYKDDLAQAQLDYDMAKQALNGSANAGKPDDHAGGGAAAAGAPLSPEQWAQSDPTLHAMLLKRQDLQDAIWRMERGGIGEAHPRRVASQADLDFMNKQIGDYVDALNKGGFRPANASPLNRQPGQVLPAIVVASPAEVEAKKNRVELIKSQLTKVDNDCQDMQSQAQLIDSIKTQIDSARGQLADVNSKYSTLQLQKLLMTNQMTILSHGDLPTEPAFDKRKQYAAMGFVGGFILPTCALLMIGLLDSRYRFSDETSTDMGGVPLLGILPNLPDLLTDPEQAATAAHCVHQIRTLLQISAHSADRRVFTVTSASPGDGKTSLTLALGLSFAASGSRTLLIDGDLVGAGLTARLGVQAEHGVLEAMGSKNIMEYIRGTDVADLSILPVGEAMGSYSGTISPAAVRRLVAEAKKHFDTVLVDTGPILGSIEASPVAVAADGVILCVSRGQQRPLVDRALLHLHTIGAKLSGVVFNRALARDFERAVSSMSMPALPGTTGDGRKREASDTAFGPVAKAVASSVRPVTGQGTERN